MEFNFDLENPLCGTIFAGGKDSGELPMLFSGELAISQQQLSIRCNALSLIAQVQFRNNLDPSVSYLAVNYIDRFLAKREIPEEKPWIARLLAISCLSLASKMKNISFPPADLQIEEGFVFDARTIRRMELLVLGVLEWRMRSITPFSFLRFFLSYFPSSNPIIIQSLKNHASQILFKSQIDVKSLGFKPSVIAAAALLAAARELFPAHFLPFQSALFSCEYLNRETLAESCVLMDGYDSTYAGSNGCDSSHSSLTPVTVLAGLESDKTAGSASNG